MFALNKKYLIATILLFFTEVLIALFITDRFIRPYIGDVLVVILIYCFIKSFINLPVIITAIIVLIFSFSIEFLQHLNIIEKLGLTESRIARTVIGTSFAWEDLIAYTAGTVIILVVEHYAVKATNTKSV